MGNYSLKHVSCPLCNNNDLVRISDRGQFGLPCHVKICPQEGLVFLSPRWPREKYISFYQNEYDSFYRPKILGPEDEVEKYKNIRLISCRMEAHEIIKTDWRSVLDVGAGMGWSLQYLRDNYSQFEKFDAIEASDYCVRHLKKSGISVIASDLDDDWHGRYDLIIMRHVLEHCLLPVEVLQRLAASLKKNGVLYIAVPDMMKPKGSLENYWFRAVHAFYFSRATLLAAARKAGLQAVLIKCENSEIYGFFQVARPTAYRPCDADKTDRNVFDKQMKVIKRYRVKNLGINFIWLPLMNILSKILPDRMKSVLRSLIPK